LLGSEDAPLQNGPREPCSELNVFILTQVTL